MCRVRAWVDGRLMIEWFFLLFRQAKGEPSYIHMTALPYFLLLHTAQKFFLVIDQLCGAVPAVQLTKLFADSL